MTILFLSDGRQNRGLIPAAQGAALAAGAGIPVYTVALGTDRPDAGERRAGGFFGFNRAPDRETLRAIARTTGGEYFAARSARRCRPRTTSSARVWAARTAHGGDVAVRRGGGARARRRGRAVARVGARPPLA